MKTVSDWLSSKGRWYRRNIKRGVQLLVSFPFAQPGIGTILFSMTAGIVISFGTELFLAIVKKETVFHVPQRQLVIAGTLAYAAALALSFIALKMQEFQDHLVTMGKAKETAKEKRFQFLEWPERRAVGWLILLFLLTMMAAVLTLTHSVTPSARPPG